jgi:hypothetical protein
VLGEGDIGPGRCLEAARLCGIASDRCAPLVHLQQMVARIGAKCADARPRGKQAERVHEKAELHSSLPAANIREALFFHPRPPIICVFDADRQPRPAHLGNFPR